MTDITVSRELLRQVLVRIELGGPEWERDDMIDALRAALDAESLKPVPQAMQTVIAAMQADPDYAWSWHCNVAMAYVDAGGDRYTGNQGAARFMKLLANVDPAHELPAPAQEQQPACYQFQDSNGKWCEFLDQQHYENTVAAGRWPIRALYTAQPRKAVKLTREEYDAIRLKAEQLMHQEHISWGLALMRETETAVWEKLGVTE